MNREQLRRWMITAGWTHSPSLAKAKSDYKSIGIDCKGEKGQSTEYIQLFVNMEVTDDVETIIPNIMKTG